MGLPINELAAIFQSAAGLTGDTIYGIHVSIYGNFYTVYGQ